MHDSILYFARGRGRGHALAATAIVKCLTALRPNVKTRFVSYGTGAEILREQGYSVLDLDLPDRPNPFSVECRLPRAFEEGPRPSLVVAHEEFDVPFAAREYELPCVVATDWFLDDPEDWRMESLKHAAEILFLDDAQLIARGIFREPEHVTGKVRYVGPVLRALRYRRADRASARQEAGFPLDALIVSVFIHPGRRTEQVSPLSAMLQEAFELLEAPVSKLLIWDRDSDSEFDRIMAASDLAITKGNRNIVLELAAMGVPAISVSHGLNAIDDIRTTTLTNNRTVSYSDVNAAQLARLMKEMMAKDAAGEIKSVPFEQGASGAAERLADLIR